MQDPQLNLLKTCISILKHSHSRTPLASHHASPSRISILAHSHPRTLSNRMNVLSTTLVISTLSLCVERCCTLIARHTHRFTLAVCSHTHIHSHSHIITAMCFGALHKQMLSHPTHDLVMCFYALHRELLIFALMGVAGGLLGALIVPMNEMVRLL